MNDLLEELNNEISFARFSARQFKEKLPLEDDELEANPFCSVEFDDDGYVCWTWPELHED